jgi:hypothetical protein
MVNYHIFGRGLFWQNLKSKKQMSLLRITEQTSKLMEKGIVNNVSVDGKYIFTLQTITKWSTTKAGKWEVFLFWNTFNSMWCTFNMVTQAYRKRRS